MANFTKKRNLFAGIFLVVFMTFSLAGCSLGSGKNSSKSDISISHLKPSTKLNSDIIEEYMKDIGYKKSSPHSSSENNFCYVPYTTKSILNDDNLGVDLYDCAEDFAAPESKIFLLVNETESDGCNIFQVKEDLLSENLASFTDSYDKMALENPDKLEVGKSWVVQGSGFKNVVINTLQDLRDWFKNNPDMQP